MERVVDPFIPCPYNHQHRVPRSRIQAHIVKCEKVYPPLAICPYNATHRFPEDQIKAHIHACPSREQLLLEDKPANKSSAAMTTIQPVVTSQYLDQDDPDYECWD